MKDLSVLKPDMATLGQERLGLTPFGMLSHLFVRELAKRAGAEIGMYRPVPLELLEESAGENIWPPRIRLDLNLTLVLDRLRKAVEADRAEKKRSEKKQASTVLERRTVEQVVLREVYERYARTQQTTLSFPQLYKSLSLAVEKTAERQFGRESDRPYGRGLTRAEAERFFEQAAKALAEQTAAPRRTTGEERMSRRVERAANPAFFQPVWRTGIYRSTFYGTNTKGRAVVPASQAGSARLTGAGRSGSPILRMERGTILPAVPLLTSQMMTAPAAGGWKPEWREEHPGYLTSNEPAMKETAGSILLPDLLRMRREAALAAQERGGLTAGEDVLEWTAPDEHPGAEEQRELVRTIDRLVSWTLRKTVQESTPSAPAATVEPQQKRMERDGRLPADREEHRSGLREMQDRPEDHSAVQKPGAVLGTTGAEEAVLAEPERALRTELEDRPSEQQEKLRQMEAGAAVSEAETENRVGVAAPGPGAALGVPGTQELSPAPPELTFRSEPEDEPQQREALSRADVEAAGRLEKAKETGSDVSVPHPAVPAGRETAEKEKARTAAEPAHMDGAPERTANIRSSQETGITAPGPSAVLGIPETRDQIPTVQELVHLDGVSESAPADRSLSDRQTGQMEETGPAARAEDERSAEEGSKPSSRAEQENEPQQRAEMPSVGLPASRDLSPEAGELTFLQEDGSERQGIPFQTPVTTEIRQQNEGVKTVWRDMRTIKTIPNDRLRSQVKQTTSNSWLLGRVNQTVPTFRLHSRTEREAPGDGLPMQELSTAQAMRAAAAPLPAMPDAPVTGEDEWPELALAGQMDAQSAAQPEKPASGPEQVDDYFKSLPAWAQNLLQKQSGMPGPPFAAPHGEQTMGEQIVWTAPGMSPPPVSPQWNMIQSGDEASRPSQTEWKTPGRREETVRQAHISEAEIRRTADRVYRLIEERLGRELRRSGR